MNKTIVTVILLVACVGLAVALFVVKTGQTRQQQEDTRTIEAISNQLTEAQDQLNGLAR